MQFSALILEIKSENNTLKFLRSSIVKEWLPFAKLTFRKSLENKDE